MNSEPLVSVIMIFFNAEKFFEEAIDSVFAQSYEHWELLLVDDGSTDDSTKIALKFAEQYPLKVRYLEHEGHQNRGMSATRNLGIRNAKGEYITFLDSDDVWLPQKLERQVEIFTSHPEVALVCNPAQWWYSWSGKPEDASRDFVQKLDVNLNAVVQPPTLLTLFLEDEWASLCDILVRREVIEDVGGYEENFRGMYEDQAFHAKLCLNNPVYVANGYWYRYRQHSYACTRISHITGQHYSARLVFLNWLEKYLSKQGAKNTKVWQVLQKELRPYRCPVRRIKRLAKQVANQVLPAPVDSWLITQWQARKQVSN